MLFARLFHPPSVGQASNMAFMNVIWSSHSCSGVWRDST